MKKTLVVLVIQVLSIGFSGNFAGLFFSQAEAHRAVVKKDELERWGFKPVQEERLFQASGKLIIPYQKNSLAFPVELNKVENQFGGAMHQLQDYTKPDYFHAGIDIRTDIQQPIRTPVAGKIEAGYYAYTDADDGSTEKHFLSLKDALENKAAPRWGERYFEIAVTDEAGYRFEFHHVDRATLPQEILSKILNQGTVSAGELVGHVVRWSGQNNGLEYHHLHYNILSNEGLYINPFYVSKKVEDKIAPIIRDVLVTTVAKHDFVNRCEEKNYLTVDELNQEAQGYLVIHALDYISGKHFPLPPAKVKVHFGKDQSFAWDFTQALVDQNLFLPDIRDVYLRFHCNSKGITSVGTLNSRFYMKIPIPPHFSGRALIQVTDQVGNSTFKAIQIKGQSI